MKKLVKGFLVLAVLFGMVNSVASAGDWTGTTIIRSGSGTVGTTSRMIGCNQNGC